MHPTPPIQEYTVCLQTVLLPTSHGCCPARPARGQPRQLKHRYCGHQSYDYEATDQHTWLGASHVDPSHGLFVASMMQQATPRGKKWRGSLRGPNFILPHNSPTRILFPSKSRTTSLLFDFCRSLANSRALTPLLSRFFPDPAQSPLQIIYPDPDGALPPPPRCSAIPQHPHIAPHHTSSNNPTR